MNTTRHRAQIRRARQSRQAQNARNFDPKHVSFEAREAYVIYGGRIEEHKKAHPVREFNSIFSPTRI